MAKKANAKKALAKKPVAKKVLAKKPAAKAPNAKKALAKKPAPAAKKALTKKPAAKKPLAKKPPTPAAVTKPATVTKQAGGRAPARSTPARDALTTLARKRAISATFGPANDSSVVEAYMSDVDHPFKAEMQAVRQIILGASPKIAERIKWNAPSFYYKADLGAFHPRATEYAHLILLFPDGLGMDDDAQLLEGSHKHRREIKFRSLDDVAAKKPALQRLIQRWVALRDAEDA